MSKINKIKKFGLLQTFYFYIFLIFKLLTIRYEQIISNTKFIMLGKLNKDIIAKTDPHVVIGTPW